MKKLATTLLGPVLALILGTPAFAADAAPANARRIDINTASETELKTTLGVDDADARRIVESRPYAKKDDLKTKHVMTPEAFEKVKRLIESVC